MLEITLGMENEFITYFEYRSRKESDHIPRKLKGKEFSTSTVEKSTRKIEFDPNIYQIPGQLKIAFI
jgi:hypothetical protein